MIWLQQHLASADPSVAVDGKCTAATAAALQAFQTAHALPAHGMTDAATWLALLAAPLRPWTGRSGGRVLRPYWRASGDTAT